MPKTKEPRSTTKPNLPSVAEKPEPVKSTTEKLKSKKESIKLETLPTDGGDKPAANPGKKTEASDLKSKLNEKKEAPAVIFPAVSAWESGSKKPMHGTIQIRLPVAITGDFVPRRIRTDLRGITNKQRFGLNVLMEGMVCDGGSLANGQQVNNHVNSLRCLLEMIADAAEKNINEISANV